MDQSAEYAGHSFRGLSLSGVRTSICMPKLGICFDVAQGLPFTIQNRYYFITHGHMDHAAGIPYIISQKALAHENQPPFYMPNSLVQPLSQIMRLWEKIEGHPYQEKFIGLRAEEKIEINPNYLIQTFQTTHRIESLGYTLIKKTKKLKKEFQNLPQTEIIQKSKMGVEVNELHLTPEVCFTGDTQIEFLDHEQVRQAQVLFLECTYLDDKKTIQHARVWGHIHLDELIPKLDLLESKWIVLKHVSARYSTREALQILEKKLPSEHKSRVVLFPGR